MRWLYLLILDDGFFFFESLVALGDCGSIYTRYDDCGMER